MWFSIISQVFSFLGGPVAKALVAAYQAHLTAVNADNVTAANLAGQEIAAQTAEINATTQLKIAEIGHPFEVEKLFAYVTLVFYFKVLIWDKVLGSWTGGSTDAVTGAVGVWAGLIMSFYFAKRTAENVFRIIKR